MQFQYLLLKIIQDRHEHSSFKVDVIVLKNNEKIASRVNDDSDIDINEFDSL